MEPSTRKPHNQDAGYIASLRSASDRAFVVIYDAKEAGLDTADGRYAVACQAHNEIVNTTSMPKARSAMKDPKSFCSGCRGDA